MFDFINLMTHPEIYDEANKTVLGEFKRETPKSLDMRDFASLRATLCDFNCHIERDKKTIEEKNYKGSI